MFLKIQDMLNRLKGAPILVLGSKVGCNQIVYNRLDRGEAYRRRPLTCSLGISPLEDGKHDQVLVRLSIQNLDGAEYSYDNEGSLQENSWSFFALRYVGVLLLFICYFIFFGVFDLVTSIFSQFHIFLTP